MIDRKNQAIPDETVMKNKAIEYAKNQLDNLRQIDNVVRELLTSEDFDFNRDFGIYIVQDLDKLEEISIDFGDESFLLEKKFLDELIQTYRVYFVTERTIFVPLLAAPKWIKGLIKEKDFEMQIFAPGFTLEDDKFHLEVVEYDSELRETLLKISDGRLLFLFTEYSKLMD